MLQPPDTDAPTIFMSRTSVVNDDTTTLTTSRVHVSLTRARGGCGDGERRCVCVRRSVASCAVPVNINLWRSRPTHHRGVNVQFRQRQGRARSEIRTVVVKWREVLEEGQDECLELHGDRQAAHLVRALAAQPPHPPGRQVAQTLHAPGSSLQLSLDDCHIVLDLKQRLRSWSATNIRCLSLMAKY